MNAKYVFPLSALLATALLAGCATTDPDAGWPDARPLGDAQDAYRPPESEASTASAETPPRGDTLTLRDALSRALVQNPELQRFAYEVRARESERVQASRWPNPTLGIESEDITPEDPFNVNRAEQAGRLRQRFPLGGDAGAREDVAAARRDLAGWDYEAQRLATFAEVTTAFADVLAAQRRLALSVNLVTLANNLYETVATQVDVGEVSPVELERAKVERAQAEIERDRAAEELQVARHELVATWGADEARFEAATGDLSDASAPPALEALRPLTKRNPRLARYEAELRQQEEQIDLEVARLIPNPQLTAGGQRFGGRGEQALTLGLALPIPLWDRNQGAIDAAQHRLTATRRARQEAQSEVLADLESAYRDLRAAHEEVLRLREVVLPSARSAYEAYREGYRLGKFELIRVLDAQETFFEAQLQQVRALRRYHRSAARVERITATPLENIESPGDE